MLQSFSIDHHLTRHTNDFFYLRSFGTPEEKAKMDRRYWMAECMDGEKVLAHAWTFLHATSRMHDVTGAKVVEDCLGEEGWRGYCI